MSDDNLPVFFDRMIFIIKYPSQGITKDAECLLKRYPVPGKVRCRLSPVPFEFWAHTAENTLTRHDTFSHHDAAVLLKNLSGLTLLPGAQAVSIARRDAKHPPSHGDAKS